MTINRGKFNLLGVQIAAVDYGYVVEQIIQAARRRQLLTVSALAVHGVMTGALDQQQQYRLNQLDLVVPDGQPVRWSLNWLYDTHLPDRVYGPNLMLQVCERAARENLSVYLYGNEPEVLEALAARLQKYFPTLIIAGKQASRFRTISRPEREAIVQEIQESGAALLFIGLGCPRQEVWLYEHRNLLSIPLIAVGAAFDIHAGKMPQAPLFMQNHGLEWFFRLLHEPRRLWRRYLLLNPVFIALFILQAFRLKLILPEQAKHPGQDLYIG